MGAAYEIAQLLFGTGIRLTDRYDGNALLHADDSVKDDAVAIYFEHAKNRHDEYMQAIGDYSNACNWFPAVKSKDLTEHGRQIQNALYAYVESVISPDVDQELWILQLEERDAA